VIAIGGGKADESWENDLGLRQTLIVCLACLGQPALGGIHPSAYPVEKFAGQLGAVRQTQHPAKP